MEVSIKIIQLILVLGLIIFDSRGWSFYAGKTLWRESGEVLSLFLFFLVFIGYFGSGVVIHNKIYGNISTINLKILN